jgi:hypothetical protein
LEALFEGKSISESEDDEYRSDDSSPTIKSESNQPLSGPSSIWMQCSNVVSQSLQTQSECSQKKKISSEGDSNDIDGELCNDYEIDPSSLIDVELDGESLGDSELEVEDIANEAISDGNPLE